MKILNPALTAHIQQEVTTMAWCWRIRRKDGVQLGFTSLDQDIIIDGLPYRAATGFFPNAISTSNQLDVNNTELNSIISHDSISEKDIVGGKYDYARMDLFLVNYLALPSALTLTPPNCIEVMMGGIWGEVSNSDRTFRVESRSKAQLLTQKIAQVTSRTCRAQLGDDDCRVNLTPFTHALSVVSVVGDRIIQISPSFSQRDDYFGQGTLTFTSGQNSDLKFSIQSYNNTTKAIALFEVTPYPIAASDTFLAVAGCDKTLGSCKRFNNVLNFRGEPHVPGADKLLAGFTG